MGLQHNIKVVVTDLDGTLLNEHHQIAPYTKSVFQELHRQNFLIVIATGRHHLDAMPIVSKIELPFYLVTSNGARIHAPNQELLFSVNMPSESVQSLLSAAVDPEITTVLFREKVWLTNKHNDKLNAFQPEVHYHPELVDFATLEDFTAIKVFFTHHKHSKLLELRQQILEQHEGRFSHAFSLPYCLEFMEKSVDKKTAIDKILELENLKFENVIAFGDGYNDEQMLCAAAQGKIMGNAPESLQTKLAHLEVIGDNVQESVAKYLKEHVLLPVTN